MSLKGKNVLVTGAAGFLASHIVDTLVDAGANVTAIDNLRSGTLENLQEAISRQVRFERIDVRDAEEVRRIMKEQKVEVVFHLAANANVPESVKDPKYDFETNAIGTFNILSNCRGNNVERVIYAASAAIYGEPEHIPIDESCPPRPISPYGASKLASEGLGFAYYHSYGVPFVSLRIFNTFGPRQRRYVMYDMLRKLRETPGKLEVLGTGEQRRDFCYVSDTVNAFILAAEKEVALGEALNVAGQGTISIKELAQKMIEILGLEGKTEIHYTGESWRGDIYNLVPDISKIRAKLGFNPGVSLGEGILRLNEWFDNYYPRLS